MQRNTFPLQPLCGSYNYTVLQSSTDLNSQVCHQRLPHTKEIQDAVSLFFGLCHDQTVFWC